jgi:hypothetical protein
VDESDPEPTERVAAGMAAPPLCDAAKARHEPSLGRD